MSFRAWMFAIAIGLIAGLGQAQEQAPDEQGQVETNQPPAQPLPIPFPIEIFENEAQTEARQRSEEESRQREIDDLVAQQGMNDATRAMNNATQEMRDYAYAQTWLIGIGTVLLIGTLLLTLGANSAARGAVKVTREIGEKQLRAYVAYSHMNVSGAAEPGDIQERTGYLFSPKFKNTGQQSGHH